MEEANYYSTPNKDWPILTTYEAGQVIDVKFVMTAYHWVSGSGTTQTRRVHPPVGALSRHMCFVSVT